MNGLLQAHPPTISYGVIGCSMYENENSILCCVAKDDWGFGDVGVIDDSIVFVQRKLAFKEGALNVFNVGDSENKFCAMAALFGVSKSALAIRLQKKGLLGEYIFAGYESLLDIFPDTAA